LTAVLVSLVPVLLVTDGPIKLRFPEEDPGGPVYARVERPFLVHTDQYAAIIFYRDPECVPEDFNLLDNVDLVGFPANARAFQCPLTVDGFQMWTTYPFPGQPNLVFTNGSGAVPVWFVAWNELQGALADDVLTIGELRLVPSLQQGFANHFQEVLHLTAAAQTHSLNLTTSGANGGWPFVRRDLCVPERRGEERPNSSRLTVTVAQERGRPFTGRSRLLYLSALHRPGRSSPERPNHAASAWLRMAFSDFPMQGRIDQSPGKTRLPAQAPFHILAEAQPPRFRRPPARTTAAPAG
jgi:hypothetical protein